MHNAPNTSAPQPAPEPPYFCQEEYVSIHKPVEYKHISRRSSLSLALDGFVYRGAPRRRRRHNPYHQHQHHHHQQQHQPPTTNAAIGATQQYSWGPSSLGVASGSGIPPQSNHAHAHAHVHAPPPPPPPPAPVHPPPPPAPSPALQQSQPQPPTIVLHKPQNKTIWEGLGKRGPDTMPGTSGQIVDWPPLDMRLVRILQERQGKEGSLE